MSNQRQFDHEKLDVYQLALSFVSWLTDLIAELRQSKSTQLREIIDQVDRASTSIALNIAEGNGRRSTKQRARFFDDARGSATESAACLDILIAKRAATGERVMEGKQTLLRIVSMLTKLGVQARFYVVLHRERGRSIRLYCFHMAFQRLDFT